VRFSQERRSRRRHHGLGPGSAHLAQPDPSVGRRRADRPVPMRNWSAGSRDLSAVQVWSSGAGAGARRVKPPRAAPSLT